MKRQKHILPLSLLSAAGLLLSGTAAFAQGKNPKAPPTRTPATKTGLNKLVKPTDADGGKDTPYSKLPPPKFDQNGDPLPENQYDKIPGELQKKPAAPGKPDPIYDTPPKPTGKAKRPLDENGDPIENQYDVLPKELKPPIYDTPPKPTGKGGIQRQDSGPIELPDPSNPPKPTRPAPILQRQDSGPITLPDAPSGNSPRGTLQRQDSGPIELPDPSNPPKPTRPAPTLQRQDSGPITLPDAPNNNPPKGTLQRQDSDMDIDPAIPPSGKTVPKAQDEIYSNKGLDLRDPAQKRADNKAAADKRAAALKEFNEFRKADAAANGKAPTGTNTSTNKAKAPTGYSIPELPGENRDQPPGYSIPTLPGNRLRPNPNAVGYVIPELASPIPQQLPRSSQSGRLQAQESDDYWVPPLPKKP